MEKLKVQGHHVNYEKHCGKVKKKTQGHHTKFPI